MHPVKIPYRSRFGSGSVAFTDSASFRANNCLAVPGTNGVDLNANAAVTNAPLMRFQQQPPVHPNIARKQALNVMLDTTPISDIALPPGLQPTSPVNGSSGVAQFYMLDDKITGVLALGSFASG